MIGSASKHHEIDADNILLSWQFKQQQEYTQTLQTKYEKETGQITYYSDQADYEYVVSDSSGGNISDDSSK